jgi:hypothetical protein
MKYMSSQSGAFYDWLLCLWVRLHSICRLFTVRQTDVQGWTESSEEKYEILLSGMLSFRQVFEPDTFPVLVRWANIVSACHMKHRRQLYLFKAQWLLYVPAWLDSTFSAFCPQHVFTCFVRISEQTAIISLYSINWLVSITKNVFVYCAVWTETLCAIWAEFSIIPS